MARTWTTQKIVLLRLMWERDERASVIGERLGCSRSAVLGKLNRMGLLGRMPQDERRRRFRAAWVDRRKRNCFSSDPSSSSAFSLR